MAFSDSIGQRFVVSSFGESHGRCIGVLIHGCPAGLELSEDDIQPDLDRRRPGQSQVTTARQEGDKVEILSGVFNGKTTGAPLSMAIWNKDVKSDWYHKHKDTPRPGHADYPAWVKYGGFNDYRGGGMFSGRITASFVMAGTVAKKLLSTQLNMEILAHTVQVGDIVIKGQISPEMVRENARKNQVKCGDPKVAEQMIRKILEVKHDGDSIGSAVEAIALNPPVGLGGPIWNPIDAELTKYLFLIPAVKGVEFGDGFDVSLMKGCKHTNSLKFQGEKVISEKNIAGGISGGLTTGMPIRCRIAFKPPMPSGIELQTVNLKTKEEVKIKMGNRGRDDPCIAPRAVPIVEGVMAMCLVDYAMRAGLINRILKSK